jgi:hypothetical protein
VHDSSRTRSLRAWVSMAALIAGCGGGERAPYAPVGADVELESPCSGLAQTIEVEDERAPEVACPDQERTLLCYGHWAAHCDSDGKLVELVNCREHEQVCAPHKCASAEDCTGCRSCVPGSVECGDNGELHVCRADGSAYELAEVCAEDEGRYCSLSARGCEDLCAAAEREKSYIGCEYWAVATANEQLEFEQQDADGLCSPFPFAIQIANPQGVPADVVITSAGRGERRVRVAPFEVATVELPCSLELKGGTEEQLSARTRDGVHHVKSNVPVTVYQFNPLEFRSELSDGTPIFSHTNDASLLLPVHALSGDYLVLAQPSLKVVSTPVRESLEPFTMQGPGFVAIIGAEEEPVAVEIVSSAHTLASADGTVPALAPGDVLEVTLERGEVLQLLSASPEDCDGEPTDTARGQVFTYCKVPAAYDLTGTQVRADGKVSVISGHDCMFLPYDRWACDHLEEALFPVQAWGREILVSVSEPADCKPAIPNMVRVLSGADDNRVHFVPEVHEPVVLARGEYVEFEITADVLVTASAAILVGQFLLGQDYEGVHNDAVLAKGDPSMSLGIPVEQWRSRYSFAAPETFPDNFVNIIAREGQQVLVDGRVVEGFMPIEGTQMAAASLPVASGQHRVDSLGPFGIVVYGYAPYTSYMLPGGLDLNRINGPD